MNKLLIVRVLLAMAGTASAQEKHRPFDPVNEFSAFAEYSNSSSHILLGRAGGRKLAAVGGSYSRRLVTGRAMSWRWELDILPVMLLRNPFESSTTVVTALPGIFPIFVEGPMPGTYTASGFLYAACTSASGYGVFLGDTSTESNVPVEAYAYNNVCSHAWAYGGGVGPLGQRVNLFPRHRLQPYVSANAGFAMFSKMVPMVDATKFNFTFEAGVGFEYYLQPRRSLSIDYRYHHISNANTGLENPGVDNGTLKISYVFGR